MKYFDISAFPVNHELSKRLGFSKIYCSGKDILVLPRPSQQQEMPQIVSGSDIGMLVGAARDADVIGIMPDVLNKKLLEKVAESEKSIFININGLVLAGRRERQQRLQEIRKLIFAAHKLKCSAKIVSLATSNAELLSVGQMQVLAGMITKGQGGSDLLVDSI